MVRKKADENKIPGLNPNDYILILRKPGFAWFEETDIQFEATDSTELEGLQNTEYLISLPSFRTRFFAICTFHWL